MVNKRSITVAIITLMVLPALFPVVGPNANALGTSTYNGAFSSLAIDSQGQPHISSYDLECGDLRYSWRDNAGWHSVTVDRSGWDPARNMGTSYGHVGMYTSLVLDASDRPHISYYDAGMGDVKYATQADPSSGGYGKWTIETVWSCSNPAPNDYSVPAPCHTSIGLDLGGNPHIAFHNGLSGVKGLWHAWRDPRSWFDDSHWLAERVEKGDVGYSPSLKMNDANLPYIAYYDADLGDIKYAHRRYPTIPYAGADPNAWLFKDIATVGKITPRYDESLPNNIRNNLGNIYLGYGDSLYPWPCGSISMAVSPTDHPAIPDAYPDILISYFDPYSGIENGKLMTYDPGLHGYFDEHGDLLQKVDSSYHIIDTDGTGLYNSIALLPDGSAYVCYIDYVNRRLLYQNIVSRDRSDWDRSNCFTNYIVDEGGMTVGAYCSLSFNTHASQPRAIISYLDSNVVTSEGLGDDNLKVAEQVPEASDIPPWRCPWRWVYSLADIGYESPVPIT